MRVFCRPCLGPASVSCVSRCRLNLGSSRATTRLRGSVRESTENTLVVIGFFSRVANLTGDVREGPCSSRKRRILSPDFTSKRP